MTPRWSAALVVALIAARAFAEGPFTPDESLKRLNVGGGMEASLWASEPMFSNPTNIDIDHRGRVWVLEGINYRRWSGLAPSGDRIMILEDTDKDGKADKSKVFYQGKEIDSALGICVLGNKVIVSRSPNVFIFHDDDGNDCPDRKEVLFTGLSGEQHDHGVHAFVFGPDGKMYFNAGNEGKQILHGDGSPVVDLAGNTVNVASSTYQQGLVFRCDLDGSNFETLGWNFRNNYEVAVDSYGTIWQSDNDDDGNRGVRINYVMEFGNFGYKGELTRSNWREPRPNMEEEIPLRHWHLNDPGVVPNLLQTGQGSPTGIIHYEGELLPDVFRNQVIHCDAGPNVVRAYPVEKAGAGYTARIENLLWSETDSWYRPSDVCVAPDGSVYVADWYDPGVGGHAMGDNEPGQLRGRIYRVAPPGAAAKVPELDLKTTEGAVRGLQSPNHATRYLAWTALYAMESEAEPALTALFQSDNPVMRARALHLLARIEGRTEEFVKAAVADANADIRVTGIRIARMEGVDLGPILAQLVNDPAPEVRRECAIALRGNKSEAAADLWATLAKQYDGKDRWYLEALGIGAEGQWDRFLSAWLSAVGDKWDTPVGRDILWRARGEEIPEYLAKIIESDKTDSKTAEKFLRAFQFQPQVAKEAGLKKLLEICEEAPSDPAKWDRVGLEIVTHMPDFTVDPKSISTGLVGRMADAAEGSPQIVQIAQTFKLKDRNPQLLAFAMEGEDQTSRVQAIVLLVSTSEGREYARSLVMGSDRAKGLRVLETIGMSDNRAVLTGLSTVITSDEIDLEMKKVAIAGLASTQAGATRLIEIAEKGELAGDLKPIAAEKLAQVNPQWGDIREKAARVLPPATGLDGNPLPPTSELLAMPGDASRGAKVFENACALCHKVTGKGIEYGPDLSEIGNKLGKDALLVSILEPTAGVSFGFEGVTLFLTASEQAVGYVIQEDEKEITLREAGGAANVYPKDEIEERRAQTLSLMPEDLEKAMSAQDVADLLEYLVGLKGAN